MNALFSNKSRHKKLILVGVFCIIFIIGIGTGYGVYLLKKTKDMVSDTYEEVQRNGDKSSLRNEAVDPITHHVSVLFIGVDTGDERNYGESSRSDALLLATFNSDENSIKLLSIPRDTYTYIPELGYYSKINHAHFYGGPKATIETVEEFIKVPVDYYVRLNFDAFVEVVDALGGIKYDVPYEIYELDSKDNEDAIHILPGMQILNGEETLAIARTRKYDNDIERGLRQQEIVKSIMKEATSVSSLFKISEVLDAIGSNMSTNFTFNQLTSFLSYMTNQNVTIENIHLEGIGDYMDDGSWYYQVDETDRQKVSNVLRKHLNISKLSNFDSHYTHRIGQHPIR